MVISLMDTLVVETETEKCLRQTGSATYELIEPHLLYLKPALAHIYTTAKDENEAYVKGFHHEIIDIMRNCGQSLLTSRPLLKSRRFDLVDLGTGEYPDKTEPLIAAARSLEKPLLYIPVDISEFYLSQVAKAVRVLAPNAGIRPINRKFEELDFRNLSARGLKSGLIFLGPTYMNFSPAESARFLKKMLPPPAFPKKIFSSLTTDLPSVFAVVSTELLTYDNTPEKIRAKYDTDAFKAFAFGPLENLGCRRSHFRGSVDFNEKLHRIEFNFLCTRKDDRFRQEDRITTIVSYRTSCDTFKKNIAKYFKHRRIYISSSGNTAVAACGL